MASLGNLYHCFTDLCDKTAVISSLTHSCFHIHCLLSSYNVAPERIWSSWSAMICAGVIHANLSHFFYSPSYAQKYAQEETLHDFPRDQRSLTSLCSHWSSFWPHIFLSALSLRKLSLLSLSLEVFKKRVDVALRDMVRGYDGDELGVDSMISMVFSNLNDSMIPWKWNQIIYHILLLFNNQSL